MQTVSKKTFANKILSVPRTNRCQTRIYQQMLPEPPSGKRTPGPVYEIFRTQPHLPHTLQISKACSRLLIGGVFAGTNSCAK